MTMNYSSIATTNYPPQRRSYWTRRYSVYCKHMRIINL